jgi:hypothetical protein
MKKTLLLLNIFLFCITCFLIIRNIQLRNQQDLFNSNLNHKLIVIDSLIKEKFIFITTHHVKFYNDDAKKIIIIGNQLINDNNGNRLIYEEFSNLCKKYNNEKYLSYNSNYSIIDIKLLQLITLENISSWLIPYYQFDAYRIMAIEEELTQSNTQKEIRLWFDYVRLIDVNNGNDFVKIVYNNDTITKKDFYYKINYIPNQKGEHFIPVKVLFTNQPVVRDYSIYVNVK